MDSDESSDEQLLRDFHQGDALAFAAIVRRHRDTVYRLCCRWLYQPQQAEDATQEVFVRAYHSLPRFRFRAKTFHLAVSNHTTCLS